MYQLYKAFTDANKSLYLVGGSVRDTILGLKPKDFDYATDATPYEIREILEGTNATAIFGIGEKFGTIGAVIDGQDVEITTFRTEKYEQGSRNPVVAFGTSLVEDLSRRDFTMNAIAFDPIFGGIIDPFYGQLDLRNKVVKAVGNPNKRFQEDPLRMLRAVRFAGQLDFEIEYYTLQAIKHQAHLMSQISRERVVSEMSKILMQEKPSLGLAMLVSTGLMPYILPEIQALAEMPHDKRHKDVYAHTLQVVDQAPARLMLRWAALLHDIGKPLTIEIGKEVHFLGHEVEGGRMTRSALNRLKMDGASVAYITRAVELHMRVNGYTHDWTDGAVRRFIVEAGDLLEDLLDLSDANVTTKNVKLRAKYKRLTSELRQRIIELQALDNVVQMKSPLDGNELMALLGRPAGAWIKEIKQQLLEAVLDGTLAENDKETATKMVLEMQNA